MLSGVIEGGAAIVIALAGAFIIFGQMKENARRNKEDIEAIRVALAEGQEATQEMLIKGMNDVKEILDREKNNSRESLSREISHIRETLAMTVNEIREDIRRLDQNQNETIRMREELALLRQSVKSLHKRMDIEIPESIRGHQD